MIDEMQVGNPALIKQASLVPAQGLTVLTGETGAGKTALLSALKLLMGLPRGQGFRAGWPGWLGGQRAFLRAFLRVLGWR